MVAENWEEIKDQKQKISLVVAFLAETVLTFCQLAAASLVLELHPQLDGNQTLQTERVQMTTTTTITTTLSALETLANLFIPVHC